MTYSVSFSFVKVVRTRRGSRSSMKGTRGPSGYDAAIGAPDERLIYSHLRRRRPRRPHLSPRRPLRRRQISSWSDFTESISPLETTRPSFIPCVFLLSSLCFSVLGLHGLDDVCIAPTVNGRPGIPTVEGNSLRAASTVTVLTVEEVRLPPAR